MTIGLNEKLNKLSGGVDTEKFSKKDEFSTQDFSSISKQFKNIFNNQFDAQFQNQFDYKQMFSNGSVTNDFMSNTASKMSDDKYYSQSYNISSNEQSRNQEPSKGVDSRQDFSRTEVKTQETVRTNSVAGQAETQSQVQNTSKDTPKNEVKEHNPETLEKADRTTASKESKESSKKEEKEQISETSEQATVQKKSGAVEKLVENIQDLAVEAQVLAMLGNIQDVQNKTPEKNAKNEKEVKLSVSKTKEAEPEEKDISKDKLLVSVKSSEIENIEKLPTNEASIQKVDVNLKDVKIEKLEVKIKHQDAKQEKNNQVSDADMNKKTETSATENIQNKVSLERLTANVVSENAGAVNELDKLLNKDIIKKADTSSKHVSMSDDKSDTKVQADFKNAFLNNQNFGQNFGQDFGQAHQDAQAQLKASIMASSITLDTSKNHMQGNLQMNSLSQPTNANNMLEKNIFDQVMKNIQGNISANKSEVTMILKPESLGKVTLNIMNEKGAISAEFKAETQEAVDALNKNIQDLKDTLKQQGVVCTNLVVKLEEPNRSDNNMQYTPEQNQKDFSQDNAQNSDKHSWDNETNNQTSQSEFKQDVQEEQEQMNKSAKDQGLVDYRV